MKTPFAAVNRSVDLNLNLMGNVRSTCNLSIALFVVVCACVHPAKGQEPNSVEQRDGNRLRIKRAPVMLPESGDPKNSPLASPGEFSAVTANQNQNNDLVQMRGQPIVRQRNFGGGARLGLDDSDATQTALSRDRFVNTPQIDREGIRHFDNGRHFNLNQIPVDQAVQSIPTTDPNQQPMQRRGRQRNWRRAFDQANGPMPYF